MSALPDAPPLDDRASDENLERLRDSAAHLIDVVRRLVRIELNAGIHPLDAIVRGTMMLEGWEAAMELAAAQSPELYAREVEAALARGHERIGAERMWEWLRAPNDSLYGRTPLRVLIGHGARELARVIDKTPAPEPPASGGGDARSDAERWSR